MKQPSDPSGKDKKQFYPFNELGESWVLGPEHLIRPNSTWRMHRVPYKYEYSYHTYTESLSEDIRDLKQDDVLIVKSGRLIEVERNVNYGAARHHFPDGRPKEREGLHDPYMYHHMLSAQSKYLLRIEAAVESHFFAVRTFDRTVNLKFENRAMIDGNTREVLRNEAMLQAWQRDFSQIYGGDRT